MCALHKMQRPEGLKHPLSIPQAPFCPAVSTFSFLLTGGRGRRLCSASSSCGGSASFQKLSAGFSLPGSGGVKEAPAKALHPPEGSEAKLSGIKIVRISLTTVCLRQTPWEGRRPSFNSLTSDSGCLCRLISLNPLWNPAFIPQYPAAGCPRSPAYLPPTALRRPLSRHLPSGRADTCRGSSRLPDEVVLSLRALVSQWEEESFTEQKVIDLFLMKWLSDSFYYCYY